MPAAGEGMTEEEVRRAISFAYQLAQEHEQDMQVAKCGCFGTKLMVVRPKV